VRSLGPAALTIDGTHSRRPLRTFGCRASQERAIDPRSGSCPLPHSSLPPNDGGLGTGSRSPGRTRERVRWTRTRDGRTDPTASGRPCRSRRSRASLGRARAGNGILHPVAATSVRATGSHRGSRPRRPRITPSALLRQMSPESQQDSKGGDPKRRR
jgi:hypothetical protein